MSKFEIVLDTMSSLTSLCYLYFELRTNLTNCPTPLLLNLNMFCILATLVSHIIVSYCSS